MHIADIDYMKTGRGTDCNIDWKNIVYSIIRRIYEFAWSRNICQEQSQSC